MVRDPGCTGYAVMKSFQSSSSSYFSGSAGAIYPLLKRLEASSLIIAKKSKAGSRTRKHYTVSSEGKKALKKWLAGPIPEEDVSFVVDLLRTRALFFANLTKAQQHKFVKDVRSQVQARIKSQVSYLSKHPDTGKYERLAARSVIISEQARLVWLKELEKAIDE